MNPAKLPLNPNCFAKSLVPSLVALLMPIAARGTALPSHLNRETPSYQPPPIAQTLDPQNNLSDLERQVLEEMNRARTDPQAYANWLESIKQYYYGNLLQLPGQPPIRTQEGVRAVDEAIRFLRAVSPLPPLRLSAGMSMGAKDHVNDIGFKGTIGHYGSDGSQFLDRIDRYGSSSGAVGENISYGATAPQAVVMQLIVDDGVAGRLHRDNIFYSEFNTTGIACGAHRRYEQICAIVYSADYRDRIALTPNPTTAPIDPTRISRPPSSAALPVPPAEVVVETPTTPPVLTAPPVLPAEVIVETPTTPPVLATPPVPPTPSEPAVPSVQIAVEEPTSSTTPPSETEQPVPTLELPPAPSEASSVEAPPPPQPAEATPTPPANFPQAAVRIVLQEEGTLADGDSVYERDGSLYDVYTFQGRAGQAIAITVESSDFDTFLAVFDEGDQIVGQNDDINENNTNSLLEVTLPRDGAYRIFINGYDARDRGNYTVNVVE
jgi:uncharacterized protein YkwD